ncbi:MAG: hypothetical protein KKC19_02645 [Nanoarchaeota archaeon]|nr:hypothetical protein [Nanoarchaeota archaeon]
MGLLDYASPELKERLISTEMQIPIYAAQNKILNLRKKEYSKHYHELADRSQGLIRLYYKYKETRTKKDYLNNLLDIRETLRNSGLVNKLTLHFLDIAKKSGSKIPLAISLKMDKLPRTDFSSDAEVEPLLENYFSN